MGEKQHFRNFVDGQWREPADGRTTDLVDPVTGEVFASAPLSGAAGRGPGIRRRGPRVRDLARHHARRAAAWRC